MKKIFLILALIFTSSCVEEEHHYYYDKPSKHSLYRGGDYERMASKFNNRVKPSESMQAGIPKGKKKRSYYDTMQDDDRYSSDYRSYANEREETQFESEEDEYSGYFKVGNPYEIQGVNYIPQDYEEFEETGISSWYGDDFDGKLTANGEIYNMSHMTAAHPTLPLPSLVRVTNLRNGLSVIVRVNDRGPFAKERIIDVSEKAAILLGFKDQGTTEVKVELLRNDTDDLLKRLKIRNRI